MNSGCRSFFVRLRTLSVFFVHGVRKSMKKTRESLINPSLCRRSHTSGYCPSISVTIFRALDICLVFGVWFGKAAFAKVTLVKAIELQEIRANTKPWRFGRNRKSKSKSSGNGWQIKLNKQMKRVKWTEVRALPPRELESVLNAITTCIDT